MTESQLRSKDGAPQVVNPPHASHIGATGPWFVAVGASGSAGLSDIGELLAGLPHDLDAVVMVVLHRLWDKPSHLREILAKRCRLPVVIAKDGERFERSRVYIGEPADHLTLAATQFGALLKDPDRRYGNRTVDLLFRSVAAHGEARTIGIVLSGSLDDGSGGLAAIHHAGGLTMVLVPSVPARRGMPENAIAFDGPISLIGSPGQIAQAVRSAVGAA